MVPVLSLAAAVVERPFEDLGDSSRAMIAATRSASGSRPGASAAASCPARAEDAPGDLAAMADRTFDLRGGGPATEAGAGAGIEAAAL